MNRGARAVQAVVMIDEDGGAAMPEREADAGTGSDTDDGVQTPERRAADLGPGNEGTSTELKTTATEEAGEEGAAGSVQTKRAGARSCFLAVRTQEAAALKGTVEEGH